MFPKLSDWLLRTGLTRAIYFSGTLVIGKGLFKKKLRVQAYRRGENDVPFVRLTFVVTGFLSYESMPIEIRLSDARELVRLLGEVGEYFDAMERPMAGGRPASAGPPFQNFADWFRRTTLSGTIVHSPGALVVKPSLIELRLSVQACRSHGQGAAYTLLDLTATSPLSYEGKSAELSLAETRELARMVQEAIQSVGADRRSDS
ncbi:MAG: hypothetical protein ABJF10_03575 [Chthoniobacter sp.]|uniref:hypothetical protein n=1 Tax=Chthoniobacter sp. TaxID=2510640 RepID=UPI0032AB395E